MLSKIHRQNRNEICMPFALIANTTDRNGQERNEKSRYFLIQKINKNKRFWKGFTPETGRSIFYFENAA